jgi:hypothetical protein
LQRIPWRHFVGPNYRAVSDALCGAWQAGQDLFSEHEITSPEGEIFDWPQVKDQSRNTQIAAVLQLAPLLRGTITTRAAVNGYRRLVEKHPDWLDLNRMSRQSEERVDKVLREAGLGSVAKFAAQVLVRNAAALAGRDLERIFQGVRDFHEIHFLIGIPRYAEPAKNFPHLENLGLIGFGGTGKVTALILSMLMDKGLIGQFLLPVSADIHYLRIFLACQAIKIPRRRNVVTAYTLSRVAREISLNRADPSVPRYNDDISIAAYLLGNRVCSRHPQMTANPILPEVRRKTAGGRYTPIEELCKLARRSKEMGSCAELCPIEEYCTLIVPSGPYHEFGYLAPVRKLRQVLAAKGFV